MTTNIKRIQGRDGRIYWIEQGDKLYENRMSAGSWQAGNFKFAQTLIDNWQRCLDIGSNMACSAVQYADKFQSVECFEPTPLNIDLWRKTIADNEITNCNLYEVALGEQEKITEIVLHDKNGGHNHLDNSDRLQWNGKEWRERKPKQRTRSTNTVEVKTLDSYNFTDVGFMKLDVEGYEKFVLEGGVNTINNNRPTIQLEIRAAQCRKFGYWAEDMIEWIRRLDYEVVSKKRGLLTGTFKSSKTELLYNGEYYKGEMDLFFQPVERSRYAVREEIINNLFEEI